MQVLNFDNKLVEVNIDEIEEFLKEMNLEHQGLN